jgi:predicted PurR-regulated permease PerM
MTEIIDLKLLAINVGAFTVSCYDYLEPMLKILLLAATLGYTLHKWYKLYKKKK